MRFCRVCIEAGVGEERLLFREENNDAVAAGERASETPGSLNRERKESSQHLSFVLVVPGPLPAPCCLSAGAAMAGEENLSWVDALSLPPRNHALVHKSNRLTKPAARSFSRYETKERTFVGG